jgi:hypothetical protein
MGDKCKVHGLRYTVQGINEGPKVKGVIFKDYGVQCVVYGCKRRKAQGAGHKVKKTFMVFHAPCALCPSPFIYLSSLIL